MKPARLARPLPLFGRTAPPPCDTPPADAGSLYTPAHPLYGIVFLYAVSETLLWGARTNATGAAARTSFAQAALGICLLGAVHYLEGVDLRHAPAKLGARRISGAWMSVAALAALPAWVALVQGEARAGRAGLVTLLGAALAAVWQEGFYRGFVFRGLMRRHGFVLSAAVAATLLAGESVLAGVQGRTTPSACVRLGILELPLSFALCALFGLSGSLWPGVLVRFAVLAAAAAPGAVWPLGPVALLLWILLAAIGRRRA